MSKTKKMQAFDELRKQIAEADTQLTIMLTKHSSGVLIEKALARREILHDQLHELAEELAYI